MEQYKKIVERVLKEGTRKPNRTGVDTISTFNVNYEIDISKGFPLLTTKKVSWKNIVIENLWFLSGDNNVDFLQKHQCGFWDHWIDDEGKVPSAYGNFWRNFPDKQQTNDQIRYVIDQLKNNPMSRRMVVSAWDPAHAQNSKLPPCHAFWVINVQLDHNGNPSLCLHLTQRSCDIGLGLPYNIAGYAFIMSLLSRFSGIKVGVFAHTLIDAHIYTCKPNGTQSEYDHIPGLKEQINRKLSPLPTLHIDERIQHLEDIEGLFELETSEVMEYFLLEKYNPHPNIFLKPAV